jgi:LmbE family N-acetylglucosaminyl deacetylase
LLSLGTVLMVWAHPDDETYLVGGLSAALTDAGQRVVCVTATRGEAGGDAADLAEIRTAELDVALAMLGVDEHRWLDYPDGGCAVVDDITAAARIRAVVDEVRPDTVVTFGPDGFTGHPDHQAVSRWVDLAVASYDVRLLHAVAREHRVDPSLDEELLDRKVAALLAQESQTAGLVAAVGLARFRAWVATEALAEPA